MTDIPGTTRDLVTERVDIDGVTITLVDTAGVHGAPADAVEAEGIARARAAAGVADLAIVVLDRSRPMNGDDRALLDAATAAAVASSLRTSAICQPAWHPAAAGAMQVSRQTARALTFSARAIATRFRTRTPARHAGGHERAPRGPADAARGGAAPCGRRGRARTPEEFVAADLAEARDPLEEVTGRDTGRRAGGNLQPGFALESNSQAK